jgi:hypothetical protein
LRYIAAKEKQQADENNKNQTPDRELSVLTGHRGFITTKFIRNEVDATCFQGATMGELWQQRFVGISMQKI